MNRSLFLLPLALISAAGASGPTTIEIPAPARALAFQPKGGVVVAAMALKGVGFYRLSDEGGFLPPGEGADHHGDWPTLAATPVPGGGFLLADRFGYLRLVESAENSTEGRFEQTGIWPCEGIPTDLALVSGRLYVAAGAVGVLIFEWQGDRSEPRLRARYPFVDYSKDLSVVGTNIYLADNEEVGAQLLSAPDILRPIQRQGFSFGFVDTVSHWNGLIAVGSRHRGVQLITTDTATPVAEPIDLRPFPGRQVGWLRSVEFDKGGRLLICEGAAGGRLMKVEEQAQEWSVEEIAKVEDGGQGVLHGIFLPDGRLLVSSEFGHLILWDAPR